MSDTEFGDQASQIATRLQDLGPDDRIAAACRGSGNPVALAWIAENLRLRDTSTVVDLGAGLGGPSAWMRARYGCRVVAVEPEEQAARAAVATFGLTTVVADADMSPFAADAFANALLLGVVSVVSRPHTVLGEARRIAGALGVMDYCSTGTEPVRAGGSTFPTEAKLREMVAVYWRLEQFAGVSVETPHTWSRASDDVEVEPDPDEAAVVEAIDDGRIAPIMLVARR
jgi:ubiquinone/menaquinone biosynthesis C-methylase UbiE